MSHDALLGLALGMVAGAVLVEMCKPAKDFVATATSDVKKKLGKAIQKTKEEITEATK